MPDLMDFKMCFFVAPEFPVGGDGKGILTEYATASKVSSCPTW